MLTQDNAGRFWHRGTKIGLVYATIAFVWFGVTTTQEPGGPHAWLSNLGVFVVVFPFAAASHAYAIAERQRPPAPDPIAPSTSQDSG